jgi:hypothetical protein
MNALGRIPMSGDLRDRLTISGLPSGIKAEKRAELVQKLATIADLRVEAELKIGQIATSIEKAWEGPRPK